MNSELGYTYEINKFVLIKQSDTDWKEMTSIKDEFYLALDQSTNECTIFSAYLPSKFLEKYMQMNLFVSSKFYIQNINLFNIYTFMFLKP